MGLHKNKTQDKIKKNKKRGKQRQVTSISKLRIRGEALKTEFHGTESGCDK